MGFPLFLRMYAASNTAGTHKVEQFCGAEIGSVSALAISCSLVVMQRIESEKPFVDVYRAYVAEVILYWSVALWVSCSVGTIRERSTRELPAGPSPYYERPDNSSAAEADPSPSLA